MEHATKITMIKESCHYGFKYFCDGTPNRSVIKSAAELKRLPRCPEYIRCPIRKIKVYK